MASTKLEIDQQIPSVTKKITQETIDQLISDKAEGVAAGEEDPALNQD